MPYPNNYSRAFGFKGYQDVHPNTPLPGVQVDAEMDAASQSIDAMVAFIQKFARADGRLANNSVGVDQLSADLVIGFKEPSTWEPGVAYLAADTVFYSNAFYTCTAAHTSGNTFAPENWSLIVDFGAQAAAAASSATASAASAAVSVAARATTAALGTTSDLLAVFGAGTTLTNGYTVVTSGRTAAGDGGGCLFYYDSTDTTTASNGGTVRVDAQGRRWKMVPGRTDLAEVFGAVGNGHLGLAATDDYAAIQAALNWLGSQRGGLLTFPPKAYRISGGTLAPPKGVTMRGSGPWQGQFIENEGVPLCTAFLNDTNNDTVLISALSVCVENIIFASPQPVLQSQNVPGTGVLAGVNIRYAGYGLTPGTYALTIDGGFGSGATGTATVGASGKVTSCAITSGGTGYYDANAGPLGLPRVRVTVTGGGQDGAHIRLGPGVSSVRIRDYAMFGKAFQITCNNNEIIRNITGSYTTGSAVIPCTNTTGLTVNMVATNLTNPYSIDQLNYIAAINPGVSFTLAFVPDQASAGSSDKFIFGDFIYFANVEISGGSHWGGKYWQKYLNCTGESLTIRDQFQVNPDQCGDFVYSAPTLTWDGVNIDGVFAPKAYGALFMSPPQRWDAIFIGNVTKGIALAVGGRLVYGGSLIRSGLTGAGAQIYAPCHVGISMKSVVGATLIGNTVDVTGNSGDYGLVMDENCYGNTLINGADPSIGATVRWSLANQRSHIIGPFGKQTPCRQVNANFSFGLSDSTVIVDATGGARTGLLPALSSLTAAQAGLRFTMVNASGVNGAVADGNGGNINGASTHTISAIYSKATYEYSGDGLNWYVVA
jgi:hypothetical protein